MSVSQTPPVPVNPEPIQIEKQVKLDPMIPAAMIQNPNESAKVSEYDMFTFETTMRDMIKEAIRPIASSAEIDRVRLVSTHMFITDLQQRIIELEQFAKIKPQHANKAKTEKIEQDYKQQTEILRSKTSTLYQQPNFSTNRQMTTTRFDDVESKIYQLEEKIDKCSDRCMRNYEFGESNFKNFKEYTDHQRMYFDAKQNWASEAKNHYQSMLKDFVEYKEQLNEKIKNYLEEHAVKLIEIDQNHSQVKKEIIQLQDTVFKLCLSQESTDNFTKDINEIIGGFNVKLCQQEDFKANRSEVIEIRDNLKKYKRKQKVKVQNLRDSLLTLENYIERYSPLVVVKTVSEMLKPMIDDVKLKKFKKLSDKMYQDMTLAITQDQGTGSIFKNILQINEYVSQQLARKIDLTKPTLMAEKKKEESQNVSETAQTQENLKKEKQQKKIQEQMQAQELIQRQNDSLKEKIKENFMKVKTEIDDQLIHAKKTNLKQSEDISLALERSQSFARQWQKEKEYESNVIISELISANETKETIKNLQQQVKDLKKSSEESHQLLRSYIFTAQSYFMGNKKNEPVNLFQNSNLLIQEEKSLPQTNCVSINSERAISPTKNFVLQRQQQSQLQQRRRTMSRQMDDQVRGGIKNNFTHSQEILVNNINFENTANDSILSSQYYNSEKRLIKVVKPSTTLPYRSRVTIESVLKNNHNRNLSREKISVDFQQNNLKFVIKPVSQKLPLMEQK